MEILVAIFSHYSFLIVLVGVIVLALTSGVLATFLVLKQESLVADTLSHATLPGVVLAFLILQTKNIYVLLIGGMISALIAHLLINWFKKMDKININSILATILSSFFGLGLVFLTVSQKNPDAAQAGIRAIIFGQAAGINQTDVLIMLGVCLVVLLITVLLFKEIKVSIFDPQFAAISGFNPAIITGLLVGLTIIAVVLEIQIIGVVLTATMLVAPALTSLQWSNKFFPVLIISCLTGIVSAIGGCIISSIIPGLSTGPVISVIAGIICIFSIIFGRYGYVFMKLKQRRLVKEQREC